MTDTINDYGLVEKARGGDQVAFLLLYERHRSSIFRFLYRVSGSVEVAEEITHDCLLSLIRNSAEPMAAATASFRVQLYSTARTLWMERLSNSVQAPFVENIGLPAPASTSENPIKALPEGSASEVRAAVGNLPLLEREALVLSDYEGLKLSEIARIVGAADEEVFARLERARQRLRDTLTSGSK